MADAALKTESPARAVLHVGCGAKTIEALPAPFRDGSWAEIRLDIDPAVRPDIIGDITNMREVGDGAVDAIFSSHNIEHLEAHNVGKALGEFRRVLRPKGFVLVTCPDLQAVAAVVAEGRLDEPLYVSPAGPIAPIDILYGLRRSLAEGRGFMAHRTGFTLKSLAAAMADAGFQSYAGLRRPSRYDLWMIATSARVDEKSLSETLRGLVI